MKSEITAAASRVVVLPIEDTPFCVRDAFQYFIIYISQLRVFIVCFILLSTDNYCFIKSPSFIKFVIFYLM